MAGHLGDGIDLHHAVLGQQALDALQQRHVHVLPQRQHQRVGVQRLELAGGLRLAVGVERHLLDGQRLAHSPGDGAEPLDLDAFLQRLLKLEIMRGHPVAGAAIDDDGVGGAQTPRGARHVDRGVAAAINHHAAAQHRLLRALHRAQHRHRVEDARAVLGGNVGALGDMGADGQIGRVGLFRRHARHDVGDLFVVAKRHAHVGDALHFGVEHVARQAVFRDAEAHHAARRRPGLDHRDAMAHAAQVVGRRQARRPGAHHQHMLAALDRRRGEGPSPLQRLVAEEPLDRVDADGGIQLGAVTDLFAGVIADPAHDRGERVVAGQVGPGGLVVAAFGVKQPALDVLARRALVVARRQTVHIDRPLGAPGAGLVGQRRAGVERDREGFLHGHDVASASSRPKRSMLRSALA